MARRPTLGLIFPALVDFGAMCWGAFDAAAYHGAHAVCFQGSPLDSPIGFDAQANLLYDLISAQTPLDGLVIWTGWFGQFVGAEDSARFLRRFGDLPIVSISERIDGIPCILGDNRRSVFDIVDHLVEAHNCRRIAFVNGPPDHVESAERYRAYLDALRQHGLPPDPALVLRAQFTRDAGRSAAHRLLDEHGPTFDAVITGDDFVALGVIDGLQTRGLRVPEDVAVTGFDDTPYARAAIPPLTTVRQSAYEQGYQGADLLLRRLAGEETPDKVTLPMRLAIRQSCGCSSPVVLRAVSTTTPAGDAARGDLRRHRDPILAAVQDATAAHTDIPPRLVETLGEAFIAELDGASDIGFIDVLDAALRDLVDTGLDIFLCQDIISAMRQTILPLLVERKTIVLATNLWGQARVLIGETALRIRAQRQLTAELRTRQLREIGQELITTFDLDALLALLAREVPTLGIAGCWLALYDLSLNARIDAVPESAYLMHGGSGDAAAETERFPAGSFALDRLLDGPAPRQLVLEPLYFRERQLGYALFEPGPRDGTVYAALRGYLTTALYGALLFRRSEELYTQAVEARATAEKADQLKTRLLANVSHDLRTPLNVIMGYAEAALDEDSAPIPTWLAQDLRQISANAAYLRRIINDLLDLSRAEINELDLHPEVVEPRALLRSVFDDIKESVAPSPAVIWQLDLPARLPVIEGDPDRLRQIFFNLLSNSDKYTETGRITLGADVVPPYVHVWVADTGAGIPAESQARIFEPFETAPHPGHAPGIGLGLSIVRRLVALHRGALSLESAPGQGSTFHVYLPLPNLSGGHVEPSPTGQEALLLLTPRGEVPSAAAALAEKQGWALTAVQSADDLRRVLVNDARRFAAIAWDVSQPGPDDGDLIAAVRAHPALCGLPFLLYRQTPDEAQITQVMLKPFGGERLSDAIAHLLPDDPDGAILAVDDDAQTLAFYRRLVDSALPGHTLITADGGAAAIRQLEDGLAPALVILDLMMPEVDGFAVLDHLRAAEATRHVPVLVISGKILTYEDIRRLNRQDVLLHAKDVLHGDELDTVLRDLLADGMAHDRRTSELVKLALAHIHQHYDHTIVREDICRVLGISENYLSRIFREELGITLVEYINRFRVSRAKHLLRATDAPITAIAGQVGYDDPAYFSRIFKRYTGLSPRDFRRESPPPDPPG